MRVFFVTKNNKPGNKTYHFPTNKHLLTTGVDISLDQRVLLRSVRLCKEALDLHTDQLASLIPEQLTRNLVCHHNPRALCVNRDDGLVGVLRSRGEEHRGITSGRLLLVKGGNV